MIHPSDTITYDEFQIEFELPTRSWMTVAEPYRNRVYAERRLVEVRKNEPTLQFRLMTRTIIATDWTEA